MDVAACVVGRRGDDGPLVGFAPTADDGYAIVAVAPDGAHVSLPAGVDDLAALALLYFEDALDEPPEQLAATHGDVGAIVRHAAGRAETPEAKAAYALAVDAIDDGLAADVVIDRLSRAFGGGDALAYLRRRVPMLDAG